ncbi:hypothetical protein J3R03_009839 [Actinoplanes couchii]|uniref:hypothetical protein n=1 Tax=Actinoplanes couchii TaxID=403638 RepID=UPI00286682E0|nr:hypothetical protein [Actinoplanes couchii]MDR6325643.1 hypothetical protein [Actinoplanes couchii]
MLIRGADGLRVAYGTLPDRVESLTTIVLLTQPILILHVAGRFGPVPDGVTAAAAIPRTLTTAAWISCIMTATPLVLMPRPLPAEARPPAILYYLTTSTIAAVLLLRQARSKTSPTRPRLQIAAAATLLCAASLPCRTTAFTLAAAYGYLFAFHPPARFRTPRTGPPQTPPTTVGMPPQAFTTDGSTPHAATTVGMPPQAFTTDGSTPHASTTVGMPPHASTTTGPTPNARASVSSPSDDITVGNLNHGDVNRCPFKHEDVNHEDLNCGRLNHGDLNCHDFASGSFPVIARSSAARDAQSIHALIDDRQPTGPGFSAAPLISKTMADGPISRFPAHPAARRSLSHTLSGTGNRALTTQGAHMQPTQPATAAATPADIPEVATATTGNPDVATTTDVAVTTDSPDAATTTGNPDIATTADSPDAATTADNPDAATTTGNPDAATTTGNPDAATTADSPDAATTADSPDAATTADSPDAATTADSPDAAIATDSPDALVTATGSPDAITTADSTSPEPVASSGDAGLAADKAVGMQSRPETMPGPARPPLTIKLRSAVPPPGSLAPPKNR